MAKKRVYEIAKENGVSSKDLIATLKAAGIDVKAAASTVDEADVKRVLSSDGAGGNGQPSAPAAAKPAPAGDKQPPQARPRPSPRPRSPHRPSSLPSPSRLRHRRAGQRPQGQRPPAQGGGGSRDGGGAPKPQRQAPGRPGGGTGGRRRRVVIDSQASRRQAPHPPPPQRRRRSRGRGAPPPEPSESNQATAVVEPEAVRIPSGATVRDVAEHLGVQVSDVIKKLMELGEMASITQTLSDEAIGVIADEFEKKIEVVRSADEESAEPVFDDSDEDLSARPPVVTIMGHVDHGKTSLLDSIRETEVAAGEAGGITQHIGAYQVHHGDKVVTFLDTPGHEAFTAMRARGAKVTDIAVIVVAADDGVMPQTTEAIDHAKAAGVPMVIAVNKIDKEDAQPERVRGELGGQGLTPEEWGGDTIFCDVSAKTKEGLDNLLDMILLVSEVEELKANSDAPASGHVIESKLDPGRGPVVTILVQRGTLKTGDALVAGAHWGRVRAMHDFLGNRAKRAMPGEPVEVLGFDSVPDAGEPVRVVGNDREARHLAGERAIRLKTEQLARRKSASRQPRGRLRPRQGGRGRRTQHRAEGRRRRFAGGAPGPACEGVHLPGGAERAAYRGGRDHAVGRDARVRVRRGDHRLQRAPAAGGEDACGPGGRRDPELHGDLQDHRRAARRDGGHAGARGGRAVTRHGRGAPDLPCIPHRHDRRLHTSSRARSPAAPTCGWCARGRSSTTARSPH